MGPNVLCNEEGLIKAFGRLGGRARLPSIWLYAEGDTFFSVSQIKKMRAAYAAAGGAAELHVFGPIGADGHQLHSKGVGKWRVAVDRFVRKHAGF